MVYSGIKIKNNDGLVSAGRIFNEKNKKTGVVPPV